MAKADSWTILSEREVIKKIDKSALIHRGTAVPKRIRLFFEIAEMLPGDNESCV